MSPAKLRQPTPRQEASSPDTTAERLKELAVDAKLARLVATNPSAPAELLLELSHSDDKAVRKACTSNANTPVEALLKLGAQFPEQLLENPVFDLLLLAHPGLFEELPTATLNSLLKRDQVPVGLIRWAWKHRGESTLHSLLMNPYTPADVVDELCKAKDPEVRMAAEMHCTRELPEWAHEIKNDTDLRNEPRLREHLILCSTVKWSETAQRLVNRGDSETCRRCLFLTPPEGRLTIAQNSQTPAEALIQLASDSNPGVRLAVAKNSNIPAEALTRLTKDKNSDVRRMAAARCQQTPAKVLIQLATEKDSDVRKAVANNSSTPTETLAQLACDEDPFVCLAAAGNSQMPSETFMKLAKGPESMRMAVASNSQASPETLIQLAADECFAVRESAAYNSQMPGASLSMLARDENAAVRRAAASNSQTDAATLNDLATDENWYVRRAVASNGQTPLETLIRLASDRNSGVRKAVAINSNVPAKILSELAADKDPDVRRACTRQKGTGTMSEDCDQSLLSRVIAEGCSASTPSPGRRFLFTLPQCPAHILAKNFRSRTWLERFAIAGNPSTPEAVLERMGQEGNQLVRRAAAENLARRASAQDQPPTQQPPSP